ncbi:DUF1295 domain-containing protein [Streptomyces sp. ISL-99]|uniref:DUF1295 domain-containing protein n=1 Tax=Streptomyces sp. ISL-99 TaxID=2819193 RepID=UPI001BED3019|nr:DUF1295 domain-containing protein [Streptomyces sp. ISL-99]MBT2526839.1 DUF1295 domain-containing protein [Streptomyces sp. ISL-99]
MSGYPWAEFTANMAAAAGAALAVMLIVFVPAAAKGTHRLVDVAWGLAFTAVAVASYVLSGDYGDDTRRLLITGATAVWGVRLAAHIAWRGRGHGEDPRYDRMLAKAPGNRTLYALRAVYLLQAALVWLISLPVQAAQYAPEPVGPLTLVGLVVFATGLVFEAVGDFQLARFKADPAHRGRIMDRGLWSWTRHPNYFGDFLVWWGLYLMACGNWQVAAVSLISPVVMTFLLTRGSGKRLLENHMAGRPGYAAYVKRTSGFFPRPPRRPSGQEQ